MVQLQQNGGLTAVHPAKRGVKRERGKVRGVGKKNLADTDAICDENKY